MQIAVLGPGAVGGLLAAALAHAGNEVILVARPGNAAVTPRKIRLESATLGNVRARVSVVEALQQRVDVILVTVKATALSAGMLGIPPLDEPSTLVIPFMNGIDHMRELRARYGADRVVGGTIRVEAERIQPGEYRQLSPFVDVKIGPGGTRGVVTAFADQLRQAGFECDIVSSEPTLLWGKLAMLAPLALATSASGLPIGGVRNNSELARELVECCDETCNVARAEGAAVEPELVRSALWALPHGMRSSMQKDLASGNQIELKAIGGAVIEHGRVTRVPTPTTEALVDRVSRLTR